MGKDAEYLKIFKEVSKTISTTLSVEQRLKKLAEGMVKALGVKGSTIRLLDETSGTLEVAASYGLSDEYFRKGAVEADKSVYGRDAGTTRSDQGCQERSSYSVPRGDQERRASFRFSLFP